jgi:hypothetical protein
MSHLTAHSPATSVLKVRIWGDSGRGPVTTLPRGSLIATYLYFPTNYNPDYHSPILAGVPDGWTFGSDTKLKAFSDRLLSSMAGATPDNNTLNREMKSQDGPRGFNGVGLHAPSIRMQKTFVPLVLAEDVTVRKSSPNADWADTYVSAALSGVTELHGKWCSGAGCTSGPPGMMFQGGEEFWVYLDCTNNEGRQDCILSAEPAVAARRRCLKSFRQLCKPLGEFVHPPIRLSHDTRELISGVYIDALTSKALRNQDAKVNGVRRRQDFLNAGTPSNAELVDIFATRYPFRIDGDKVKDYTDQVTAAKKLLRAARRVANDIPDSDAADPAAGKPLGKYFAAKTQYENAIATAEGELDVVDDDRSPNAVETIITTFAAASKEILAIFIAEAKPISTGPGLRLNNTGSGMARPNSIYLEDDVLTGFTGISDRAFNFFGGDRRTTVYNQPVFPTEALSGHGTALVA